MMGIRPMIARNSSNNGQHRIHTADRCLPPRSQLLHMMRMQYNLNDKISFASSSMSLNSFQVLLFYCRTVYNFLMPKATIARSPKCVAVIQRSYAIFFPLAPPMTLKHLGIWGQHEETQLQISFIHAFWMFLYVELYVPYPPFTSGHLVSFLERSILRYDTQLKSIRRM